MKKTLSIILTTSLILLCNIAIAENIETQNTVNPEKELVNNTFGIETTGPLNPIITKITLLSGSEEDLIKVQKMLDNKTNQYFKIIQSIYVENISFKIEYKHTIRLKKLIYRHPRRLIFRQNRLFYRTEISGYDHYVYENVKHDVQVKQFSGRFTILRGKPLKIIPPRFIFDGEANKIITGAY